jgi:NADPH2:quinone reductase
MLAIEISQPGPPEVLRLVERPDPVPNPDELLIAVEAAGVSRADLMQRQGLYPPPPGASDIPGLDCAGTIVGMGDAVRDWQIGNRVCALLTGGGYATLCTVPAAQALTIPEGWNAIEAASLPENLFTVYDNLLTRARLRSGERALIHGGTSGIGSVAIMLAKAMGARVAATAGSEPKCRALLELGAELAINYRERDFVAEVLRWTGGAGADVILDIVGGDYLDGNLRALATDGRLAVIAIQKGSAATLDIRRMMTRRLSVMGSTLRTRSTEEKGRIAAALRRDVWPLLPARNPIRPVIDSTFSLRDAALAHRRLESGEHVGRIVLVA